MRRAILILLAILPISVLTPAATAATGPTNVTVVFDGSMYLCHPGSDGTCRRGEPAELWDSAAPLSNCASGGQPDLCDPGEDIAYSVWHWPPGLVDQAWPALAGHVCMGSIVGPSTQAFDAFCHLSSDGEIGPVFGIGPYCDLHSGSGWTTFSINDVDVETFMSWEASGGDTIPVVFRDAPDGNIIGSGTFYATGNLRPWAIAPYSNEGNCGQALTSEGFTASSVLTFSGVANITVTLG